MSLALWDMAGVDGLAVAQSLFGPAVTYLAPFQSLETELQGQSCSVLRLCDRNFRITYPGPLDALSEPLQRQVWIQQYTWLAVLSLPVNQLPMLIDVATVRPPHRLANLPNHRAVPTQIDGIATLLWQHSPAERPMIDLQVARPELERLKQYLAQRQSLILG